MATTQIADLAIDPQIVLENIIHRSLETNAFIESGVLVRDPRLDEFLAGPLGGKTIAPRFIGPLAQDDANVSTDNPATKSTPKKITGGKNVAVRQSLNQSWSAMDIVSALSGIDPVGVITQMTGDYWNGELTKRVLASLRGIVAMDIAGDKVLSLDISGETGKAALFNADAFIDAVGTLGDRASTLSAIAMHSVVYNTMLKQDLIEFIRNSEGRLIIPTYMGKRVVVDDAMTGIKVSKTEGEGANQTTTTITKYYSFLFGAGAIALGVAGGRTPFEVDRDPAAGAGGGEETVYSRLEWVIHPQGFSFAKDSTPTIAQLEDGDNWSMDFERKRIPLAALVTAG